MVAIPFPLASYPGRTPQESAGRLVNAFAEPLGPGAAGAAAIKSVAGMASFANSGQDGFRGMIEVNGVVYAAFADVLVTISASGMVDTVGSLPGLLPVTFARNNKQPIPDIAVVTENTAYVVTTSTITEITDPDLPQPNSVAFLNGWFLFTIIDARMFASGLNATTINALDFAVAEAKPDGLTRGVVFEGQYFACGPSSIEIWTGDNPNATGFPLNRATVLNRGLIGARAITGFEDGFGKGLLWVADDNAIYALSGFQPVRISTPDIDRAIEAVADKSTIEAQSYMAGGHAFSAFSADEWTWEYNLTTQKWHERRSYLQSRWRGTGNTLHAFGKWLIGDRLSGNILELSHATRKERAEPLVWEVESAPAQSFPDTMAVPRADFNFATGTGIVTGADATETSPQVAISWTDNGGQSWSYPLLREIGPQATNPRIRVNRTGRTGTQGRRWKLQVADPVHVALLGGDMQVAARR